MTNWITFFSQTGSEIVALSEATGIKPTLIVTNNMDETRYQYHPGLRKLGVPIMSARHDRLMQYLMEQKFYDETDTIITLHGYLRIIPADVCNKFKMYNGHPGAIDLYPELKGKDPQERTWENKSNYKFIGSVVHRVTPGVDEGEIIKAVHLTNVAHSLNDMYNMLRVSSLSAWNFALKEIL